MAWLLTYDPAAEKELAKLDKSVQRSVKKYLAEVCQLKDPATRGDGLTGPLAGNFSHARRFGHTVSSLGHSTLRAWSQYQSPGWFEGLEF